MAEQQSSRSVISKRRRWMQFRLRSLILLVALAAAFFSWSQYKCKQQQRLLAEIKRLGGSAKVVNIGPAWLRRLLGDENSGPLTRIVSLELPGSRLLTLNQDFVTVFPHFQEASFVNVHIEDDQKLISAAKLTFNRKGVETLAKRPQTSGDAQGRSSREAPAAP